MPWKRLQQSITTALTGGPDGDGASRRDLLAGLGLAGILAATGPILLPGSAEAQQPYYGRPPGRRRGPPPGRGRRRGPPSGAGRRPRQRFHYSNVVQRCRNERRFRRRNPHLCRQVLAARRPRGGACFWIGPFMICG